jgi:hypothetical protein
MEVGRAHLDIQRRYFRFFLDSSSSKLFVIVPRDNIRYAIYISHPGISSTSNEDAE